MFDIPKEVSFKKFLLELNSSNGSIIIADEELFF